MAIRKRIILAWCLAQSVFWSLWLGCNSKNIPYTIYIVVICIVQTAKVQDFPPKSTPFPPTNPQQIPFFPKKSPVKSLPTPSPSRSQDMAYVGAGYVLAELETEQAAQILQQLKLEDAAYILAPQPMAWPPP